MRQTQRVLTAVGATVLLLLCGRAVHADTVAKMSFGTAADNTRPNATVTMDKHNDASDGTLKLQGDGKLVTRIDPGATGISPKWDKALQNGFLDVAEFANYEKLNGVGLTSAQPARAYFYGTLSGYGGFGNGEAGTSGGTVYMVFQPTANWSRSRHGLFGSGAAASLHDTSLVELYSRNNGVLFLDCGSTDSEGKRQTAQMKVSSINWDSSKWYFVAASWQTGQTPVLYVRELSSEGPAASPAAAKAELSKGDKFVEKIPEGHNDYPFVRPFAIGARWTDTGGAQGTFDGAGARIAWFRLDNVYSSDKDIATVFESLGAK